jgi:hypothetical protein
MPHVEMKNMTQAEDPVRSRTPASAEKKGRRWWVRVILVVVSLVTAWHVFATFLWVAPPTHLRDLVPGNFLTSWMIPFFGQSWSVFAPEPINGNYTLKVRAEWVDAGGKTTVTPWINATSIELSMAQDNLFPPRAANLAVQQASQFKTAYDNLTADHRVIVALGYFKGADWRARLEKKLDSYGSTALVSAYMKQELYTDAYATQVARAVWGKQVEQVQFQVSRLNIAPFEDRKTPKRAPQPVQLADVGWRGVETLPGQSATDFARIFNEARVKAGIEN